jgi:hypothetical protein
MDLVPAGDVVPEVPEEQRSHRIYQHPRRDQIHGLLSRGRDPEWISQWLSQCYPLTDTLGNELAVGEENRKLHIGTRALRRYRERWFPEATPGVDLLPDQVHALVGRLAPGAPGTPWEIEKLEQYIQIAEHMLAESMSQDAKTLDNEGCQLIGPSDRTIALHKNAMDTIERVAKIKARFDLPGYRFAPQRTEQVIDQHQRIQQTVDSRNVNVELHGPAGIAAGEPAEPDKVAALTRLLAQGPAAAGRVLDEAIESTATELPPGDS